MKHAAPHDASTNVGVPIDAFIFGGRLSRGFPLVFEATSWKHGVFMAATMGSEATAAAFRQAAIRRDPFAMLPFCGYNMADYWRHWLRLGRRNVATPPRIFRVNWFRKDKDGNFIWPGFGENMRVLKWIIDRVKGRSFAVESPIGWMPGYQDMDFKGLDFSKEDFDNLMNVDREAWKQEINSHEELFSLLYDKLPKEFFYMRELLRSALWRTPEVWKQGAERY